MNKIALIIQLISHGVLNAHIWKIVFAIPICTCVDKLLEYSTKTQSIKLHTTSTYLDNFSSWELETNHVDNCEWIEIIPMCKQASEIYEVIYMPLSKPVYGYLGWQQVIYILEYFIIESLGKTKTYMVHASFFLIEVRQRYFVNAQK